MGILCVSSRTVCLVFTGRKWRYLVHSRKGLGPRLIPWKRQNTCHFVSYQTYIFGAKTQYNILQNGEEVYVCIIFYNFNIKHLCITTKQNVRP